MTRETQTSRPPSALSDDELLAEVVRRRRKRGLKTPELSDPNRLSPGELARHLASLELEPGATLRDVERAHGSLSAKYGPFALHEDGARSAAAKQLLASLQTAFDALRRHFTR